MDRQHGDPVEQLRAQAIDCDGWARRIDASLWDEALEFAAAQDVTASSVLRAIPVKMGGGGFYALLYFFIRKMAPGSVVETGVAAGFSSRAILMAMERNNRGHLYSSDFPYFRLENPERYIGILVEPNLRERWTLLIKGDRANLPKIAAQCGHIDILHYDSDKSVAGRTFALNALKGCIDDETLMLFDDIQDNPHFDNLARGIQRPSFIVEFQGKYIGVILPERFREWALPA